jgi:putative ABC transport system substrate-binding protein
MKRPTQRPSNQPRRDVALKSFLGMVLFVTIGGLFTWVSAQGAEIVIVRTSDAEPYVQAGAALENRLVDAHDSVRNLLAKDVSAQGITAGIGKADAVVAVGTPAARWLQKQLPADVKLVYCMVSDPADAGLLEGRPSTGVTTDVPISEQIKLITEAMPKTRSVGILYRSDAANSKEVLQSLQKSIPESWSVQAVAVNEEPSIAEAITALIAKQVDVIWTAPDAKIFDSAAVRTLLLAAVRARIPVWGFSPAFVRAGALLGVGVDPAAQGKQAAELVIECISEHAPALQRAVPPQQFQIAVNLIVARQLGVEVPESLTQRAAFVFQAEDK